ncbi:MAG: Multidrug/solvent efflux pump outer membrane protein MepC [Luteibacter sp.]|uniref:efflux transporter outer membrane subunit n=1 Tax=Luteibacter sp. TaxID=1886636 RepID=UPI00138004FC|nr:efflux transporter outer membrane subunit [Luteibacter sp.]KAF1009766.1 MAG: Multidrug/solvent efflux pump outer membrane protein MepC [Luteibacter sp.]
MMRRLMLASAIAALCAGCAAGPDYTRPSLPSPSTYTRGDTPASIGADTGTTQRFSAAPIQDDWWTMFGSAALDARVRQALAHNASLDAAKAALDAARENVAAQRATYFPSAQLSYAPSRQRDAVGTLSPTLSNNATYYSLHTARLDVSYAPDVFGLNRRTVESLTAQADGQRYQLEAAKLSIATNVVGAAITEASLQSQIEATQAVIADGEHALAILRDQARLGYASAMDVAAQESALAQARQGLPGLRKQLAQNRDLLAVLCGDAPSDAGAPEFTLDGLHLPESLPEVVPAALVDHRPDVRAAEADVHAASAEVGVALASRLPQLNLTASYGSSATTFSRMFTDDNVFWSLAGSVTQSVFDFGALKHKQRAAEAGLRQSAAQYRGVVLAAFQDVADTLYALEEDAHAYAAANDAERAAERTMTLTGEQQKLGYVGVLAAINARQAWQQARIARIQAQAERLSDSAALVQALGGGWKM